MDRRDFIRCSMLAAASGTVIGPQAMAQGTEKTKTDNQPSGRIGLRLRDVAPAHEKRACRFWANHTDGTQSH